jgi:hypothetical protein
MPAPARAFAAPRILGSLALTLQKFLQISKTQFFSIRAGRAQVSTEFLARAVLRLPSFGRATLKLKAFAGLEGIGGASYEVSQFGRGHLSAARSIALRGT